MTPPAAATVAGRRSATGLRPAGRSSRVGGARPPRRVSGPARPAPAAPSSRPSERPARAAASARAASLPRPAARASAAAAFASPAVALGGRLAAAAAAALPQPATRPSAPPRRRPTAVPRPARRPDLPLGARALEWLRTLPDHSLLDRLISGRIWIVLLGTLLVGIVTLQLTLLRLNAGIGRAIEASSALQQSNAALQLEISQESDSQLVLERAAQMGFVMPPQGSPRFVTASPTDAGTALRTMRVPNPSAATTATSATATTSTGTGTTATGTTSAATSGTVPAATTTPTGAANGTTTTTSSGTGTGTPATGATTPSPTAPVTPAAAGGASAPVGGQG